MLTYTVLLARIPVHTFLPLGRERSCSTMGTSIHKMIPSRNRLVISYPRRTQEIIIQYFALNIHATVAFGYMYFVHCVSILCFN